MDTHRILPPPCEILKSILTMDLDERKFPPLEVVASTPILGSDGKIINRPGYHRKDQLFLAPTIEIPPVPKRPTKQDVDQALAPSLAIIWKASRSPTTPASATLCRSY